MKRQPSTSGIARVLSRKRASGFTLIEILCATFAAAIVKDAKHPESAKKLILLLSSPAAAQAIHHWGMELIQH